MDLESIRRLTALRLTEWQEVQSYIDHKGCLMAFLGRALDDPDPKPCGKCASCLGRPIIRPDVSRETAVSAARYLKHAELPLECPKQAPQGAFTQHNLSGNLPHNLRAETGRILSRWGDAGWGGIVADDKHNGRFRDELVDAVAEMVQQRWKPHPAPTWMTCIPSQNHPHLVPDFAKRLAAKLGLPFVPAIQKIRNNEAQKGQQNRFHQCRNLDGVFTINGKVLPGPVYLLDDVVDSGWTITVAAALLRQVGSGPVWPIALTTSSIGG
jgi:ATP-dependent DNA helicase RecQ